MLECKAVLPLMTTETGMIMAAIEESLNQHLARFQQLLTRSALVARRYIEAEAATPISDAARERAQNVLSYTLKAAEAWPATRDLLLALAPRMELAGYRTEWLPFLEDGVAQSQRLGDQTAEAALQLHCGYLYRLISNYAQAQNCLRASVTYYAALGDTEGQARALNQLAYLAWQQHQYAEAEHLAHEAINIVDDMALEKAVSLSALGLVAHNRGRYTEAEAHHFDALLIRTDHRVDKEIAWSLQNLGIAAGAQGKYAIAIEYYERALTLLNTVHDPAHSAIIQMNLGVAYYHQSNYSQALEILTAAEQSLHRVSDEYNLAKLLTTKGLCYLAQYQWEFAEQAFQASTDLFQQLGDLSWYLNAYDGLGISYLEQEQFEQALAIFQTIVTQLPKIEGTPAYTYLTTTLATQIAQAEAKQVERGKSVYLPSRNQG